MKKNNLIVIIALVIFSISISGCYGYRDHDGRHRSHDRDGHFGR